MAIEYEYGPNDGLSDHDRDGKELLQNNMHICVGFLFESADEKS